MDRIEPFIARDTWFQAQILWGSHGEVTIM